MQGNEFADAVYKRLTKGGLERIAAKTYDRHMGGQTVRAGKSAKKGKSAAKKTAKKARKKAKPKLWERVKKEMHVLFCTDDSKYASLRKKALGRNQTAIVSSLTVAIAAVIGTKAAAITPVVLMALYGFLEVGVNGWCAEK
jgi:hypothetical protein